MTGSLRTLPVSLGTAPKDMHKTNLQVETNCIYIRKNEAAWKKKLFDLCIVNLHWCRKGGDCKSMEKLVQQGMTV